MDSLYFNVIQSSAVMHSVVMSVGWWEMSGDQLDVKQEFIEWLKMLK